MDFHQLTVAAAARLIEQRQISPVELTQALLDRIAALDAQINAFITITGELALKQARAAEAEIGAGRYRGPMHGIPFALKDIINTEGILTSGHSKIAMDNFPAHDATVVTRLYESGAVLLGKLATHEFAHGGPSFDLPWPPARNPWNPAHFTGSSSTGPGAAVAAGFAPLTLGTDTGGSIRIPAALCGVAGFKPTYGLVSRHGVIPNSYSFDHCGPLAWTIEDCAIGLGAIAGYDSNDPTSADRPVPDYRAALVRDVRGLRIGIIRHFWEEDAPANAELAAALDTAVKVFGELGARVSNVRMRHLQDYYDVKQVIAESEIFSVHQRDLVNRPQDFGADFLGRTLAACLFTSADYVNAQRLRRQMLDEFEQLYGQYDVLLTAAGGPAPRLDQQAGNGFAQKWERPNVYPPFTVSGGPALATCIGFSASGLPLSMQLAGRPFDDATVLRAGHAYEQATPWRERRPTLMPGVARVPVTPRPRPTATLDADPGMREQTRRCAERAGLQLSADQYALLYESAPYVLAMAQRVAGKFPWQLEPAGMFSASGRIAEPKHP